jgi:apolipoprotein N-acyltransferase
MGAACGAVAGVVFFGVLVSWSWYFGAVAFLPFVIFLSGWWALTGGVVGWLDARGVASAPVVAAVWVLAEAGRSRVPFGGFSWGETGYAFHDLIPGRSLAAWGGVALVSLVAVSVNGLVADVVFGLFPHAPSGTGWWRRPVLGLAAVALAVLAAAALLPGTTTTGRLRVALVQGNDKNRELSAGEVAARYLPRNHLRLAEGITGPVDLVVLPESALDADPRTDPFLDDALTALAARLDAVVLAGGNTDAPGGRIYNTTFMYTAQGRAPLVYRKRHLVPFGEYVPWREALSFIKALEQIPRDFAPGRRATLFPVPGTGTRGGPAEFEVGALICFDSAFGPLARDYARGGAEAIVVSTNNRSYRRSANSAQHLAMSQWRAAETGRPILHAGISGLSGIIDQRGDLRARTSLFEPTVLTGEVETTTGRTPYVAVGEWAVAVAGVLAASAAWRARRRRTVNSAP